MRYYPVWLFLLAMASCGKTAENTNDQEAVKPQQVYQPRMIGDIPFDAALDDPEFKVCHGEFRIAQYFAMGEKTYDGEKILLDRFFISQYDTKDVPNQSGLISIRFIVNCEGETGRFRLQGMNFNFEPMSFDDRISGQLMRLTKSFNQWKTFKNDMDRVVEYYQYLIFKIEDGELKEIMP